MSKAKLRSCLAVVLLPLPLLASWATASLAVAEPLLLSLPVRCELGRTCFIQHHVDIDPTSETRDYACGRASYDGHDGVDFRALSAEGVGTGIDVLAAAGGRVSRVRDHIPDAFAREKGRAATTARECGNGLVIDHGKGMETQYCHLRQGSIVVAPGQSVKRGGVLGRVGYSGLADFAHLHFTVRKDGRAIDPFSGLPGGKNAEAGSACIERGSAALPPGSLWEPTTAQKLAYKPAEIIQSGFAAAIPGWTTLERNHTSVAPVAPASDGLVLFARAINLAGGDRLRFLVVGPNGFRVDHTTPPLDRAKAIYIAGAGKRLTAPRWAAGSYRGTVEIRRQGKVIATAKAELEVP